MHPGSRRSTVLDIYGIILAAAFVLFAITMLWLEGEHR